MNPAEFLADLISIDYSSSESVYSSQKRIDALVESFTQQSSAILYASPLIKKELPKNNIKFSKKIIVKKKGGWSRQFWLLLRRAWMQVYLSTLPLFTCLITICYSLYDIIRFRENLFFVVHKLPGSVLTIL